MAEESDDSKQPGGYKRHLTIAAAGGSPDEAVMRKTGPMLENFYKTLSWQLPDGTKRVGLHISSSHYLFRITLPDGGELLEYYFPLLDLSVLFDMEGKL